ncbi:MAG TPA: hypothetical protein VEQ66_03435 [Propionibacteriaceae bacterium]|nr:hypothetical protein [Propionibacteriaceae bacterium]
MSTALATRRRPWWRLLGYLLKRATLAEIHGYQSTYRFVFRRPRVPAGAAGFSYHQPILAILIVLIVVSAVELVVVDVIVRRWDHIRLPLLVLGVWGLVWMLGLLFGMLTRPHAVGPDGIRVRSGPGVDLPISWDQIRAVAKRKRARRDKEPMIAVDDQGDATVHLWIGSETNIEVDLERPTEVRLPHGRERVRRIALYVDDPKSFLDEVRRHIG